MKENKFKVWCEFEFEGEIIKKMEGPESWFLLTQTGKLITYGPGEPLQPLDKAYIKAIPLFYTGYKDKEGEEIYQGDILVLKDEKGRIICKDFVVRNLIEDGYALAGNKYIKKIIGNKYENPELLEVKP